MYFWGLCILYEMLVRRIFEKMSWADKSSLTVLDRTSFPVNIDIGSCSQESGM